MCVSVGVLGGVHEGVDGGRGILCCGLDLMASLWQQAGCKVWSGICFGGEM